MERRWQPDTLLHQQDGGWKHVVHRAERPDARALPGGGGSSDKGWCRSSQPARAHPHQWVHCYRNHHKVTNCDILHQGLKFISFGSVMLTFVYFFEPVILLFSAYLCSIFCFKDVKHIYFVHFSSCVLIFLPFIHFASRHRAASWTAVRARRWKRRWHRRWGKQRESGRADHRRGQAACIHRRNRRGLLGHPHGLQCLDLLPPQEEEGAEPLHSLVRIHTRRSDRKTEMDDCVFCLRELGRPSLYEIWNNMTQGCCNFSNNK